MRPYILLAAALLAMPSFAQRTAAPLVDDPYVWLEDWTGPRSMAWVEMENRRTLERLQADPRYRIFYRDLLTIASAKDRIPDPHIIAGRIFNFWRDAEHPQGIWRVTDPAQYRSPNPRWKVLLDLDALSRVEGRKWVWKGAECLDPEERRCLLSLSDGGEDSVTIREFDIDRREFVDGGFVLPPSKQSAIWVDKDRLLVARDWGKGSMTASGYPFIVKALSRGDDLDSAVEVYRGAATDQVSSAPFVLRDGRGNRAVFVTRNVTFFENETYLLTATGTKRARLPGKASIAGLVDGHAIVLTREEWTAGGETVPAGAVAAVSLVDLGNGGDLVPRVLFVPHARQSVSNVIATRSRLVVTVDDNVRGRALVFTPDTWKSKKLALPDNMAIKIAAASSGSDAVYFSVTGFLDPTTLWFVDAVKPASLKKIKALPARFDTRGLITEQFEATSSDGTRIPYFVVRRKDVRERPMPTIMTAYGGFQVSRMPFYSGGLGKTWLERGGSFVLANIRGGGEFGPAWHEAGRKTKRQIVYDDFAAVASDLIERKLTEAGKLGIYGGSNGGLLMGVAFTQRPELWKAVAIQVPLLDMNRYEQIAAGASWVDEYGSVSVPEERAFLRKISPYANIRKGTSYPEPLIWTTTKDDRVGPQHARKFAARLKEYGIPYLFYEDLAGGHAGDADVEQGARLQALQMTYFTQKLMGSETKP
ncbi:prolyl oligopeptidase [Sphingopyxis sp. YR583]|uniref:prolyl oligopeptidase family serine peptidase n=1 Tax=Sphingopyxis sp. YR583 TaxID=1881047 RepID=UPI0008A73BD2|nr:prolyl oligopeptidase family serine peptidase [Sphingopyxis sp. YR583]SEH12759.1 prolyl oligopeptidase [Sphingopyxis sp. YR583]